MLAAVSPAVVVPSLLVLQEQGYGLLKGIPTLIIASASIDNVFAISAFGILLATAFSSANIVFTILRGPLEVVVGIGVGVVFGVILWFLPNRNQVKHYNLFILFQSYLTRVTLPVQMQASELINARFY